jgi:hypothetical protein
MTVREVCFKSWECVGYFLSSYGNHLLNSFLHSESYSCIIYTITSSSTIISVVDVGCFTMYKVVRIPHKRENWSLSPNFSKFSRPMKIFPSFSPALVVTTQALESLLSKKTFTKFGWEGKRQLMYFVVGSTLIN